MFLSFVTIWTLMFYNILTFDANGNAVINPNGRPGVGSQSHGPTVRSTGVRNVTR
jgi:hypothetical protein